MTEERRRRRRRVNPVEESEDQKPILLESEREEEIERHSVTTLATRTEQIASEPLSTSKGIDQIKAELVEEKRSALLESDYWDETHSWGSDSQVESDEYWHFVGRYE